MLRNRKVNVKISKSEIRVANKYDKYDALPIPGWRNLGNSGAYSKDQIDYSNKYTVDFISKNFQDTGLKKESILKLNKLTTLNRKMIVGRIGLVKGELINEINKNLRDLFKI